MLKDKLLLLRRVFLIQNWICMMRQPKKQLLKVIENLMYKDYREGELPWRIKLPEAQ